MRIFKTVILFYLWAFFQPLLFSQSIIVSGSWSLTIDATNLQGGAGTDLIGTYESSINQVLADIQPSSYGKTWMITVHKQDVYWNSGLHLDIRRQAYTDLNGGLSYFELTNISQNFFWSTKRKRTSSIQIQFRLRGVSVGILPNAYSTTVVYTLTDS